MPRNIELGIWNHYQHKNIIPKAAEIPSFAGKPEKKQKQRNAQERALHFRKTATRVSGTFWLSNREASGFTVFPVGLIGFRAYRV